MESDWQPEELIIHQMLEITEWLKLTFKCDLLNTFDPISVDYLNELSSEFVPLSTQNSVSMQGERGHMETGLIFCQQTAL